MIESASPAAVLRRLLSPFYPPRPAPPGLAHVHAAARPAACPLRRLGTPTANRAPGVPPVATRGGLRTPVRALVSYLRHLLSGGVFGVSCVVQAVALMHADRPSQPG